MEEYSLMALWSSMGHHPLTTMLKGITLLLLRIHFPLTKIQVFLVLAVIRLLFQRVEQKGLELMVQVMWELGQPHQLLNSKFKARLLLPTSCPGIHCTWGD